MERLQANLKKLEELQAKRAFMFREITYLLKVNDKPNQIQRPAPVITPKFKR